MQNQRRQKRLGTATKPCGTGVANLRENFKKKNTNTALQTRRTTRPHDDIPTHIERYTIVSYNKVLRSTHGSCGHRQQAQKGNNHQRHIGREKKLKQTMPRL